LAQSNQPSRSSFFERQGGSRCLAVLRLVAMSAVFLSGTSTAWADDCGLAGGRACNINERIPSCDINLVEAGGVCVRPNCGAEGQKLCSPIQRTTFNWILMTPLPVPQPCDINLKDIGGACRHPASCGREGQQACGVFERLPSCDINLIESGGRCVRPPLCGGLGQAPCDLFVRGPARTCDVNLIPRAGQCVRPGSSTASAGGGGAAPAPAPARTGAVPPPPPPPARGAAAAPPPPPPPAQQSQAGSMEQDTDRTGSDIYGFNVAQSDPSMCQTACTVNGQCAAWTYVKPGIQGPLPRCYLKSAAPAPARNSCCVSGAKGGGPPPPPPSSPLLRRR
jgi:hypothetical protein